MKPIHQAHCPTLAFATAAKSAIEDELRRVLKTAGDDLTRGIESPMVHDAFAALSDLTLRGGKRLRGLLLLAAAGACGHTDWQKLVPAACALECLQTFMLIHDDWMDGDDLRRGGPAVHTSLQATYGQAQGSAAAIIAGDMALGLAQTTLLRTQAAPDHLLACIAAFADVQPRVGVGQLLDIEAAAQSSAHVERTYDLKTGSYSAVCPLRMGGLLAGAHERQLEALVNFGRPLGLAYQLRDDLLDIDDAPQEPSQAKSRGSDQRARKTTALELQAVDLSLAQRRYEIETQIAALAEEAEAALASGGFESLGRELLHGFCRAMAVRRS